MMAMSTIRIIFKFYANRNSQVEFYIDILEIKRIQGRNISYVLYEKILSWKQRISEC